MKEKLPLNEQDIKKLWKHLLPTILFPFVAAGLFYAFFSIFSKGSNFLQDGISLYILVGFSIFFFGIITYMIWGYAIDLRRGFKYRIEGKITDKKLNVHTSTTHTFNGRTGSSSTQSSATRHHSVFIDGVQYSIEPEHYGKLKVGAVIIIEKAPKSHLTLFLEVGKIDELPFENSIETDDDKRKFLSCTPRKVSFTQDDFKALKRGFWSKAKYRLIVISAMGLLIVPFVVGKMQINIFYLFPLMLIAIYQFWKFNKEWRLYYRNKQYAYKEGIPTIVQDKYKLTYNGKGTNNVKTSQGTIKVNEQLYEILNAGDKIILYKLAKSKQILSITSAANEEVYVM
ncbi:MAG TPA: hypothetical protein PLM81_09340 [Ginsengibacter sp.]|nr:hypothetical protein [Ginsengibacter sp.]HUN01828.1 hypothetical protein [Niabella sp.]